jgi:GAF domain-containing protein
MSDPNEALAASLRALSQFLLGDQTPREGLLRVAQLGESALEGAQATGVTLLEDGQPKTFAFTSDEAPEVDQLQYAEGDGPCLTAYKEKKVVRVECNRTEERWPAFTQRAIEKGVLSSLSVPLVVDDRGIGALNFYSHVEQAFSSEDEALGVAFAEQAAVIMANAEACWGARDHIRNLDEAIRSRAVIEQAKGILMARSKVDADEAFDMLRRASQRENRKLRDVAADLVDRARKGAPGTPS